MLTAANRSTHRAYARKIYVPGALSNEFFTVRYRRVYIRKLHGTTFDGWMKLRLLGICAVIFFSLSSTSIMMSQHLRLAHRAGWCAEQFANASGTAANAGSSSSSCYFPVRPPRLGDDGVDDDVGDGDSDGDGGDGDDGMIDCCIYQPDPKQIQ